MYGQALSANGILRGMFTDTEDDQIVKALIDAYTASQTLVTTLQAKEGDLTKSEK